MFNKLGVAVAASLAAMLVSAPQRAIARSCFEDGVGCPAAHIISKRALRRLSCQNLFLVRNSIYRDNLYCFATARARSYFSNRGCRFTSVAHVPLNVFERVNVKRISAVEAERGCS